MSNTKTAHVPGKGSRQGWHFASWETLLAGVTEKALIKVEGRRVYSQNEFVILERLSDFLKFPLLRKRLVTVEKAGTKKPTTCIEKAKD